MKGSLCALLLLSGCALDYIVSAPPLPAPLRAIPYRTAPTAPLIVLASNAAASRIVPERAFEPSVLSSGRVAITVQIDLSYEVDYKDGAMIVTITGAPVGPLVVEAKRRGVVLGRSEVCMCAGSPEVLVVEVWPSDPLNQPFTASDTRAVIYIEKRDRQ